MKRWLAVLGVLLAGALLLPQHAWSQGAIVNNGLQLQGTPLSITFFDGTHTGTLQPTTLTGNRTWTLPDASGTIITTGNAGDLSGLVAVSANAPLTGDGTSTDPLGLAIDATTLSVSGGQLTANNTSAIWNANQLQSTAIDPSLSPAAGQVLTWDATNGWWTAQAVSGDNWGTQVVQVNAPLTGDGTSTDPLGLAIDATTLSVSGGQLTANNTSAIWNANQLQSTAIDPSLSPAAGQVLTWDATNGWWTAQAVSGDNWGTQVVQVNAPLTGDGTSTDPLGLAIDATTLSVSGGQLTANNTAAIWNANQLQSTAIDPSLSPAAGQVLTWDATNGWWTAQAVSGDNWGTQVVQVNAPLTGDGTSTDPLGLAIDATTLSVSGGQLTANNTSAIWNANQLQSTAIDPSLSPAAGQVLTWDATNGWWTAQAVSGDNWGTQVVQVNAPLTGDGTSTDPLGLNYNSTTLSVSGGQLTANNTAAIWNANQLCGTDLNCTALSGLGPSDAGKVLTWNGSQWTAAGIGAAGGWLVGGNALSSDGSLGTTTGFAVIFITDGSEVMRMTTDQRLDFQGGAGAYRIDLPNNANVAIGRVRANSFATYSSLRWKEDIRPIGNALERVMALRGVNFRWKPEYGGTEDIGFIMEEVDRVVPEVVDRDERTGELLGMDYSRLTALLVEALKQHVRTQEQVNARLQQENAELRQRVERLESLVEQLLRQNGERGAGSQPSTIQDAWLGQNIPNPFAGTTTIPYYVPAGVSRAELVVRDVGGRELRRLELAERGAHGQVVLEMGLMGSGTYEYALVLDGRVVAVKQMTLMR